jgi:glycine hydroxymethyltransferase
MKENEMERIGNLIADVLDKPSDASVQRRAEAEVRALCDVFPLYASRLGAYTGG